MFPVSAAAAAALVLAVVLAGSPAHARTVSVPATSPRVSVVGDGSDGGGADAVSASVVLSSDADGGDAFRVSFAQTADNTAVIATSADGDGTTHTIVAEFGPNGADVEGNVAATGDVSAGADVSAIGDVVALGNAILGLNVTAAGDCSCGDVSVMALQTELNNTKRQLADAQYNIANLASALDDVFAALENLITETEPGQRFLATDCDAITIDGAGYGDTNGVYFHSVAGLPNGGDANYRYYCKASGCANGVINQWGSTAYGWGVQVYNHHRYMNHEISTEIGPFTAIREPGASLSYAGAAPIPTLWCSDYHGPLLPPVGDRRRRATNVLSKLVGRGGRVTEH